MVEFTKLPHLTKNFPGFSLIEKSHDDPGILAL